MLKFAARQAGRLALGLLGAMVVAAGISAVATPRAPGAGSFLHALGSRLVAYVHGDFGASAISGQPALRELADHLPVTATLVAAGAVVALVVGVPLGLLFVYAPVRRAAAPVLQIVTAAPVFCAGLALAYGAHLLGWTVTVNATVGTPAPLLGSWQALQIAALPMLTVGLAGAAAVQLALRHAAARSAGEAYRGGLRRLGLSAWEIESSYGIPQMLAGLAASAGDVMAALLSAAVVAEWVFRRAGAADLFVKSVALQDWTVAALILFAFAALTFLADFLGRIGGRALADEGT